MLPIYIKKRVTNIPWWKWIIVIDLVLVTITALTKVNINLPGFVYFDLGNEMNFAVWWSTITLFLTGVLSYELFCSKKDGTKTAWLAISILFCALSWDEIGSLHERAFQGSWSNYIPYAIAAVSLLIYTLIKLFAKTQTRKSALLILVAFILFGSVALQEYIEHAINWTGWLMGVRIGIEEGTELLGTLLSLTAVVIQREPKDSQSIEALLPNLQSIKSFSYLLLFGLFLHGIVSFWLPSLPDLYERGNPAIWYPSMVVFLIFLNTARNLLTMETYNKKRLLYLVINFAAFSALICAQAPKESLIKFYVLYGIESLVIPFFYVKLNEFKIDFHILILSYLPGLLLISSLIEGIVAPFLVSGIFVYLLAQIFLLDSAPNLVPQKVVQHLEQV